MDNREFVDIVLNSTVDTNQENTVIDNSLQLFMQEVELAIKMEPGDVWGIYDSIDVSKYVFNQYVTLHQVKSEIETYIANNCEHSALFDWEVYPELIEIESMSIPALHINFTVNLTNRSDEDGSDVDDEIINTVTQTFLVGTA